MIGYDWIVLEKTLKFLFDYRSESEEGGLQTSAQAINMSGRMPSHSDDLPDFS